MEIKKEFDGDESAALLPRDFTPGTSDVICQRGKECFDHSKFYLHLCEEEILLHFSTNFTL
jgi:hypothetical protein